LTTPARPETAQELLGDRFGVDLREGEEQQKLEQFVVRQGVVRAGEKAVAQTLAVAPIPNLNSE
jgi:hypothetical protein